MCAGFQTTDKHLEPLWERACSGFEPGSCELPVRGLASSDLEQLASLAHAAFAGTVDSAPLALWTRKLSSIMSSSYGIFLPMASFIAEMPSGQLAGAVLATDFPAYKAPVIALIAVAPDAQKKGLGCCLLGHSIRALALEGFPMCRARISPGNKVSQGLFHKLGFELRSPPW